MIQYKNISFSAKTFYGVKFEPGEIKEVPGYINDPRMIRIFDTSKKVVKKPEPVEPVDVIETPKVETRGRRKKSSEPEKVSVAETQEVKITSEEETSDGNPG